MVAGRGHSGIKTGIGNAEYAYVAVVVGHVFQQPIDRIIGVAGFINFGSFFVGVKWANVHILSLTHPTAAYILGHHDVAFPKVVFQIAVPNRGKRLFSIRCTRIGRAGQQDGMFLALVFGHVDGGEQLNAVPHRNRHFFFRVVVDDPDRVGVLANDLDGNDKQAKEANIFHGLGFVNVGKIKNKIKKCRFMVSVKFGMIHVPCHLFFQ